jgi:hypothetical protein
LSTWSLSVGSTVVVVSDLRHHRSTVQRAGANEHRGKERPVSCPTPALDLVTTTTIASITTFIAAQQRPRHLVSPRANARDFVSRSTWTVTKRPLLSGSGALVVMTWPDGGRQSPSVMAASGMLHLQLSCVYSSSHAWSCHAHWTSIERLVFLITSKPPSRLPRFSSTYSPCTRYFVFVHKPDCHHGQTVFTKVPVPVPPLALGRLTSQHVRRPPHPCRCYAPIRSLAGEHDPPCIPCT